MCSNNNHTNMTGNDVKTSSSSKMNTTTTTYNNRSSTNENTSKAFERELPELPETLVERIAVQTSSDWETWGRSWAKV